ncbi:MAG TPA: helix-turn-helix domain-containing protein [Patescibacteria group bacterium]
MAKYELRLKAREMRKRGKSVKKISEELHISKSTASIWVRDIILSVRQLEELKKSMIKGSELGRVKGALIQKERRLKLIAECNKEGSKTIQNISKRELFLTGLALYWAEGSKKDGRLTFCNSDPNVIKFMIKWLKESFGIDKDRLVLRVGINEMHKEREEVVKKYWSELTGIPLSHFHKTSFKKSKVHKVYDNYDDHFGTLDVLVLKPGELYYKILGLIRALPNANVAQR